MKISYILLIIMGALVFLMLGCFLFFGVFIGLSTVEEVIKDIERLYQHRFLAGCLGFFFLCVGYYAVKVLIKRSYHDDIFVVDSEYGRTSISLAAINTSSLPLVIFGKAAYAETARNIKTAK